MSSKTFILPSTECELLMEFETCSSLSELALSSDRDISSVSRMLAKIATKLPVVEKQSGRWMLTAQGRMLNQHSRDSIHYQHALFQKQTQLRIGTNREFSARVLGKNLDAIRQILPTAQIKILAFESGCEEALLNGLIDVGIDCDRPFSPEIAFKTAVKEPIVAVCSPDFYKTNRTHLKSQTFFALPHLLCDRLAPDRIFKKTDNKMNIVAAFNDVATARSACETGVGWALLPRYAVARELTDGSLVQIETTNGGESLYGVWWLRARKHIEPLALDLKQWLKGIEL